MVFNIIITPPETREGNQSIHELHTLGIPIVLIRRKLETAVLDRVTTDTYKGAIEAIMHLVKLGHTRIAFIGGDSIHGVARGRYQGYLDGLQQAGLPIDKRLIVETNLTRESGAEAIMPLLQSEFPPTALFAANDISAIGAMQKFIQLGGSIPADLSIIGFDDISLAAHTQPPLTTVAQPKTLLGQKAVELLLTHIEHPDEHTPQEIRLSCSLVVRGSTARVPLPLERR